MSAKIEINSDTCTGCRTCIEACFVDVMRWDAAEEKPVVAYERDCVSDFLHTRKSAVKAARDPSLRVSFDI